MQFSSLLEQAQNLSKFIHTVVQTMNTKGTDCAIVCADIIGFQAIETSHGSFDTEILLHQFEILLSGFPNFIHSQNLGNGYFICFISYDVIMALPAQFEGYAQVFRQFIAQQPYTIGIRCGYCPIQGHTLMESIDIAGLICDAIPPEYTVQIKTTSLDVVSLSNTPDLYEPLTHLDHFYEEIYDTVNCAIIQYREHSQKPGAFHCVSLNQFAVELFGFSNKAQALLGGYDIVYDFVVTEDISTIIKQIAKLQL